MINKISFQGNFIIKNKYLSQAEDILTGIEKIKKDSGDKSSNRFYMERTSNIKTSPQYDVQNQKSLFDNDIPCKFIPSKS